MSLPHTAPTPDELHAYVDAQLLPERRAQVEAHLVQHAADAQRVAMYQQHKAVLRDLFQPVLDEPLPLALSRLALAPAVPTSHWLPRWSLQRVAASVVLAAFSGAAGWLAHEQYTPTPRLAQAAPLARQAAVAHAVFSPDVRRPVEIGAEHEDQLLAWLSKRMGMPMRAPKLNAQGFDLIGGRLLPGSSAPVAQFMYQDGTGQRLTLYVSSDISGKHDTAFRYAEEGSLKVFYWIDGKLGYALSAGIDKAALSLVASAVYEQLERAP